MKLLHKKRSVYLCAVFLFAIVVGLATLVNLRSVIQMSLTQIHQQGRVERIISVQRHAQRMELHFNNQVELWNQVIASKDNLEAMQTHISEFTKKEQAFNLELEILKDRADVIGEGIYTDLKYLKASHEKLGEEYRKTLISLMQGDSDAADAAIQLQSGLEAAPLAALEKLVRSIRSVGDQAISEDLNNMTKVREATITISYLTVAVGLVLVPIFLVWLYRNYIALDKARNKAREASLAKSEFVNNVSREIRTPLNGVIGILDVLKKTELTPTQKDYLQTIWCSSQTMSAVLDDILDYSKIEARVLEIKPNTFPIKPAISSVVDLFTPTADEKNLDLRVQLSDDLPNQIWCDENRLRQILLNLVDNAVNYTKTGYVEIRVNWAFDSASSTQGKLMIEVEDSGAGIAPKLLENLFEPFNQTSTTPHRHEGTGLGLPLCKHLVELMDGSITVKTELQKGSTFFLNVKAEKRSEVEAQEKEPSLEETLSENATATNDIDLKNARILIAEDNSMNTKVAMLLTKQLGLNPDVVVNGAEAVQAYVANHYDIILMDLQMPIMDGEEATRKIRECTGDLNTPWIIALTASAMTQNREEALAAGMNDFISKPMSKDVLRQKLLDAISGIKSRSQNVLAATSV